MKNTTTYEQSDDFFDPGTKKFELSSGFSSGDSFNIRETTKYQGKLSRAIAKGEKRVYDIFYSGDTQKKLKRNAKRLTKKGRSIFTKIINK